jgi:hypothetical protein
MAENGEFCCSILTMNPQSKHPRVNTRLFINSMGVGLIFFNVKKIQTLLRCFFLIKTNIIMNLK